MYDNMGKVYLMSSSNYLGINIKPRMDRKKQKRKHKLRAQEHKNEGTKERITTHGNRSGKQRVLLPSGHGGKCWTPPPKLYISLMSVCYHSQRLETPNRLLFRVTQSHMRPRNDDLPECLMVWSFSQILLLCTMNLNCALQRLQKLM